MEGVGKWLATLPMENCTSGLPVSRSSPYRTPPWLMVQTSEAATGWTRWSDEDRQSTVIFAGEALTRTDMMPFEHGT